MLKFNEHDHKYTWNGKTVLSVTQILSSIGVRSSEDSFWNSISGSEFIKDNRASAFGTEFHSIAEYTLKDCLGKYDPAFEPWVNGLNKFFEDYSDLVTYNFHCQSKINTVSDYKPGFGYDFIEMPLYSRRGYAGTPDWLAESTKDGSIWLIDWKTSTQKQEHWKLQMAAYALLIKENFGIRKKINRMSVRVFENDYEPCIYKDIAKDDNLWTSILNVYKNFSK